MIWDLHVHMLGVAGKTPQEKMAKLIECADRFGIDRLCLYLGVTSSESPSPEKMRGDNDLVLEAMQHHHDRVFGFCYVNGNHLEESLKELDRCVANGPMVGMKLWVARQVNTPEVETLIRRAHELKAVIYQHTWIKTNKNDMLGESTPMQLAEVAKKLPHVQLICGHTGGNWELGIRAIRPYPNVYIDLAGSDPTAGIVEMAVRELGAERIIYGSDVGGRSYASQLAKVYSAHLTDRERGLILGGNLRRLMWPILKLKGIDA